ncbi:MAG TPA: HAD hydrolase family protein [Solirubrobacterales bacterium]
MPEEVVICDLDGTLLDPDARLSEFAKSGLNRLLGAGVQLTVATSRRTLSIRDRLAGVEIRLPVIEVNGAFVSELASGRRLHARLLRPEAVATTVAAMQEAGADPVVSAWDGVRDRVHCGTTLNPGSNWFAEGKRRYGTEIVGGGDLAAVPDGVAAITGFVPDPEGEALAAHLSTLLGDAASVYGATNFYVPGWTEVQVQDRLAEKGAAIEPLLAAAGLEGSRVIACGDHLNDVGLFEVADLAIAPANAHPQILELADEVVGSNREDGVVRHLLQQHPHFQRD